MKEKNVINNLLELAKAQVGIGEVPANSSNNKFNQEYYGGPVNDPRLDWCVVFVWWCFKHAGISNLFYGGGKTASCTTYAHYHQDQEVDFDQAQPGDVVLFDWSGDKTNTHHIGIIISREGNVLHTVEGNTQDNGKGGKVALRPRDRKWVSKIIRPMYAVAEKEQNGYDPILHTFSEIPSWALEAVEWGINNDLIYLDKEQKFNIYTSNLQVITWLYRREKQ